MAKGYVLLGVGCFVSVASHFKEPFDEQGGTNRRMSPEHAHDLGPLVSTSLGSSKCTVSGFQLRLPQNNSSAIVLTSADVQ